MACISTYLKGNDHACSAGDARVRVSIEIMQGRQLKRMDQARKWSSSDQGSSDPFIEVHMRRIDKITRLDESAKWKSTVLVHNRHKSPITLAQNKPLVVRPLLPGPLPRCCPGYWVPGSAETQRI